jgi:hypothetical protein
VLAEILGGVGGAPSWSPKELADLAAAAPASRLEEVRDLVTEFVFAHPEVTEARHLVATAMVSRWARSRRGVAGLPAPLTIYRLLAPRWYLASNGFPAVAAEIAMLAEQWWPACRPHQRRVLAPHVLLATVQAELALVADAIGPTGPCHRPTLRLRDRLRELDPPLVQPDLVELGLAGAVPLAAEVMRRHGCLRDLLVHDGVSEFRNVRHGFLRRPLPPPQAAAAGAADITQLLLRAAYAEYDRREVLKVGRELREQYLPVPAAGEAFLAWWEGVLPAAGALARATEAARNVVRRKESR